MDADWPDAPHRMSPPADHYEDPAAAPTRTDGLLPTPPDHPADPQDPETTIIGTPSAPLRPVKVVAALAVAALFLGGSAVVLSRMVTRDRTPAPELSVAAPAVAPPDAGPHTTLDLTAATFDLASDVSDLRVTTGPLGAEVVRVTGARAELTGATVRLTAAPGGPAKVVVVLNDRITWAVRMTGGVQRADFDLRGGTVSRFDLTGGATRIDMTLPDRREPLPIRMSGGVHTWTIHTAGELPVQARFRRGSGPVTLNGRRVPGVARNGTLTAGSGPGLNLDAVAGIGTLTVTAS